MRIELARLHVAEIFKKMKGRQLATPRQAQNFRRKTCIACSESLRNAGLRLAVSLSRKRKLFDVSGALIMLSSFPGGLINEHYSEANWRNSGCQDCGRHCLEFAR